MIKLDPALKKRFRAIGHQLHPIVTISSKGLSENILLEAERALEDHELIKIKFSVQDRALRQEISDQLLSQTGATAITFVGKVLLCYRPAKEPNAKLSNLLRSLEQAVH